MESCWDTVSKEIAERLGPFQSAVARLCTIPGVDRVTAWGPVAEIGLNMAQFPDAQHLASWAGLCPGSHESGGRRKSGKIRKGSLWLRHCQCQGARAVSLQKNNYLSALYRRLAARRGRKRATIAVANNLLVIAYYILRDQGLLPRPWTRPLRSPEPRGLRRRLTKRVEGLGFKMTFGAFGASRLEAIF
jgi:transposase